MGKGTRIRIFWGNTAFKTTINVLRSANVRSAKVRSAISSRPSSTPNYSDLYASTTLYERGFVTGSSCSGSEDDPPKSPTLGGDKYSRDESDTFFTGKLKASPNMKRAARRPLTALNIHAVNSSSEDSEEEDSAGLVPFDLPRSKPLQRYKFRATPLQNSYVE